MNAMPYSTRYQRAHDHNAMFALVYGHEALAERLKRKADANAAWAATLAPAETFQPPKAPAGGWKISRPEIGDVDDGRFDDEQEEGDRL